MAPEVKLYEVANELITKTLVLFIDEFFEEAPITIREIKVFGEEGQVHYTKIEFSKLEVSKTELTFLQNGIVWSKYFKILFLSQSFSMQSFRKVYFVFCYC